MEHGILSSIFDAKMLSPKQNQRMIVVSERFIDQWFDLRPISPREACTDQRISNRF